MAFFDLNAFLPTEEAFEVVWGRLVPGGLVAFWQLTRDSVPAEAMVYVEKVLSSNPNRIRRTATYPGLCYIAKE